MHNVCYVFSLLAVGVALAVKKNMDWLKESSAAFLNLTIQLDAWTIAEKRRLGAVL